MIENTVKVRQLQKNLAAATAFVAEEVGVGDIPGAALLVADADRVIHEYYCGTYCNGHTSAALSAGVHHLFYSFSKPISATVVALAHQKGYVDYDAPVRSYIPEYRGEWRDETTLRHLLSHSAGLPDCPLVAVNERDTWKNGIDLCCRTPVRWQPGSRTEYHARSGMLLAAEIVLRQTGADNWNDLCAQWLFKPLGAESLSFSCPQAGTTALTPIPQSLPAQITPEKFTNIGHPGAGCNGRLHDAIKILQLHLRSGEWNGCALLRPEEALQMRQVQYRNEIDADECAGQRPRHSTWGLGWMVRGRLQTHDYGYGFGFGGNTSAESFGHAGIKTLTGIADPSRNMAMIFAATDSMTESFARIRNTVADLVFDKYSEN